MTLRSRFLVGVGMLVAIHLATAFGAIGLLTRMSPAVQDILAQNVYSTAAAEDALTALLRDIAGEDTDQAARLEDAVGRARRNVTEPGEVPAIDDLERFGRLALAGDRSALIGAVAAAERLIAINREAMQRANARALSLGSTGAWAAVTLALVSFLVSIVVVWQTFAGVIEPVEELESVIRAHHAGDRFRRCQGRTTSREMKQVFAAVNRLLDASHRVE